ncbi:transcriptional antiterminator [Scandinavium goeteborgense]|uniref:Transcriptional antiterminator n=2 Tax=Scandinavium goeteborgense TaxID=1851514 RepID=A0A4R6DQT3_SCAGO|nr:transcriptional antiterminator [Scandinavium goeteborgense]
MQLDHLAVDIIKKVAAEPGLSLRALCERLGLPQRNFYYRRIKIDDWLTGEGFSPLLIDRQHGLYLHELEVEFILKQLATLDKQGYKLCAEERRDHLLLNLVCSTLPLLTQQLSQINNVSRNTTLDDLNILKSELLHQHGLTLKVSKKEGYHVIGGQLELRLCIHQLLQRTLKYAQAQVEVRVEHVLREHLTGRGLCADQVRSALLVAIDQAESHLDCVFSDKDKRLLLYMMMFSLLDTLQGHYVEFTPAQIIALRSQPECLAAASLNACLSELLNISDIAGNTLFLTLLLSVSKKIASMPNGGAEDRRLTAGIQRLVEQFQALSGVYFSDVSNLVARLFSHLGPAIHRCLFNIKSENVLRDDVIQRYPLIFQLCRHAITGLEVEYEVTFNDDELSYITISFAAWLDRKPETGEQTVLLVTEGGVSSTAILENQLRNLTVLPLDIHHISYTKFIAQPLPLATRLVVSSIALPREKLCGVHHVLVKHMLSANEKIKLRNVLESRNDNVLQHELVSALVTAAANYAPLMKEVLHEEFSGIVQRYLHQVSAGGVEQEKRSLAFHLHGRVQFSAQRLEWRTAVRKAAKPLVDQHIIANDYAEGIIAHIEKSGLTMYLSPDVLLLHAAPPEELSAPALSLLQLKHPLHFDNCTQQISPQLIILLVPSADLSHIPLLSALNDLISDEAMLQQMLGAASLQEVLSVLSVSL